MGLVEEKWAYRPPSVSGGDGQPGPLPRKPSPAATATEEQDPAPLLLLVGLHWENVLLLPVGIYR